MRGKRWLAGALALLLMTSGCAPAANEVPSEAPSETPQGQEETPSSYPPPDLAPYLLQVEGKQYTYGGDGLPLPGVTVEDDEILGRVTSTAPPNRVPEQDGEANFLEVGTPYARWSDEEHPDALVYYSGYGWHLMVPYE